MNEEILKSAIQASTFKWDKAAYAYAIAAMDRFNVIGLYFGSFKLSEVKDEFFKLSSNQEMFKRIKTFPTFKDINTNI